MYSFMTYRVKARLQRQDFLDFALASKVYSNKLVSLTQSSNMPSKECILETEN